jgi:hypothetical protein
MLEFFNSRRGTRSIVASSARGLGADALIYFDPTTPRKIVSMASRNRKALSSIVASFGRKTRRLPFCADWRNYRKPWLTYASSAAAPGQP